MSTFIDEVKKIPITDYAERVGYTLVRKGSKYVSLKEHDSVMIDTEKNAYWQNSEFSMGRKGGAGSVIDFAMNMRGLDLNSALRELAQMYGIEGNRAATVAYNKPTFSKPSSEKKREAGDIELPKAAKNNDAVIKYLTEQRHIKPEIVQSFIDRGMLYQDDKRNCVFHTERFGCKRSTGKKRFAVDLKGNDYAECFYVPPTHPSKLNNTLIVTEAVIDQMSVMSFLSDKRDIGGYAYLALTGTNKTQSIFNALDKNSQFRTVVLALDNDEAGRKATQEVTNELKERGVSVVDYPAKEGKDWNEYVSLLAEREAAERAEEQEKQRQEQERLEEQKRAEEREKDKGNPDFYRVFAVAMEIEIAAFMDKTGWQQMQVPDSITLNGDAVVVYRDATDLPNYLQVYLSETKQKQRDNEIAVNEKLAEFSDQTIADIAKYYLGKQGNPEYVLNAPNDVSVETISAVLEASEEITLSQAAVIYSAMDKAHEWNASNYQQQIDAGMSPSYRLDADFLNQLPYSLCSLATHGKADDYIEAVVMDYIQQEQEDFQTELDEFLSAKNALEVIAEQSSKEIEEVPHGEETVQTGEPVIIALESTRDYTDKTFDYKGGQEQYRWVKLSEDGMHLEPFDDKVYASPSDARVFTYENDAVKEIPYDDLVDKAYFEQVKQNDERIAAQKELTTKVQELTTKIEAIKESLSNQKSAKVQKIEVISLSDFQLDTALALQAEHPDAVYSYNLKTGELHNVSREDVLGAEPNHLWLVAEKNAWESFISEHTANIDAQQITVTCEYSESMHFEDGAEYSFAEFNDIMEKADAEYRDGHLAGMEQFGNDEEQFWEAVQDNPEAPYVEYVTPYQKTKFTVHIPSVGDFTDRQDIGDGFGSTVAFLSRYSSMKPLIPILNQAAEIQKTVEKEPKGSEQTKAAVIMKTTAYVDGKPTWYKQIDEIRENNTAQDIIAELADRKGVESGRDAFDDSPLSGEKENILIVAALSSFDANTLRMLSDTAKDGSNTVSFALDNGNQVMVDVKVKLIDMAKTYVADLSQENAKEEQDESLETEEQQQPIEAATEAIEEVETIEPAADELQQQESTHGEEVTHSEAEPEEQPVEPIIVQEQPKQENIVTEESKNAVDRAQAYIVSYRLGAVTESLEQNVIVQDKRAEQESLQKDLSLLLEKFNQASGDKVSLTEPEMALLEDSQQWLEEEKSKMDSTARVDFELSEGVKSVLSSDGYKRWLDTHSKFYAQQYSANNAILVFLQKRNASYTNSYEQWKYYGKQVKESEHGIRILAPKKAYEKNDGALFRTIKNALIKQLAMNPNQMAKYQLGTSKLTFTMISNHSIGLKIDGKENVIFPSDEAAKRFIEDKIIGKECIGFKAVSVFDISQTEVPEQLWVKRSDMLPNEVVVQDENGQPMTNKRGEVRIYNSRERQERWQTAFPNAEMVISDQMEVLSDEKARVLYDALIAVNAAKNIPVSERIDDVIRGGAIGYFSRSKSEDMPNGYIVISSALPLKEKLKTLFHETAHADLHGNLEKLAETMGLNKSEIGKTMKEIQAESVAYAFSREFGIETKTDSFSYLATYSKGFELQELQKSFAVIHKEVAELRADLEAALEERDYDIFLNKLDAERVPKEAIIEKTKEYSSFGMEQLEKAQSESAEIPSMMQEYAGQERVVSILAEMQNNSIGREYEANLIISSCRSMLQAETRESQEAVLANVQKSVERVNDSNAAHEKLVDRIIEARVEEKNSLRKAFFKDAVGTLKSMAARYPRLQNLSDNQLAYIAKSKVVKSNARLLNSSPEQFVNLVCERAEALPKVAAKNGTFVEINKCETWTEPHVFENGIMCHPRIANVITENSEQLIRDLKIKADMDGKFLPSTRCDMTVYALMDGKLQGFATTIDIGDGEQKNLLDHFETMSADDKKLTAFTKELDAGIRDNVKYAEKIFGNTTQEQTVEKPVSQPHLNMSSSEWSKEIQIHDSSSEPSLSDQKESDKHDAPSGH